MLNRPEWTPLRRMMFLNAATGGKPVSLTLTAGAAPLLVQCRRKSRLMSCAVLFAPYQDGSGDPSPESVRPIRGWRGVRLHVSPTQSAGDGATYETVFGSVVYGGTADVISGVLTANKMCYAFSGQESFRSYDIGQSTQRYSITLGTLSELITGATVSNSSCSHFSLTTSMTYGYGGARLVSPYFQPFDPNGSKFSDAAGFMTWIAGQKTAGTPVQLALPITEQTSVLTPSVIELPRGNSYIWAEMIPDYIGGILVGVDNAAYISTGKANSYTEDENFFLTVALDTGDTSSKSFVYSRYIAYVDGKSPSARFFNDLTATNVDFYSVGGTTPRTVTIASRYIIYPVYKPEAANTFIYYMRNGEKIYLAKGTNVTD